MGKGLPYNILRSKSLQTFYTYNQLLVARNCPFPYNSQAGLLAYSSSHLPSSRFPSDISASLPKYSDEFVQDSHLFPFSPDPDKNMSYLV